ncbi:uncharacterized protein LOC115375418 [Myripristis murdjan]|uniref:uncharacterized protein LOC115375418 n=1 Tax=Myripristis murdjan TaxID=586833 RepID=UPI0011760378|nr:uncharacterized protein LOC115375418 [Myripristis murdjan]
MLSLPSVALCSLCLAGVAMAEQLQQDQLPLTSSTNEKVSFRCTGTDLCDSSYVFWYQKKETETFKVILAIDRDSCAVDSRYNHPQKDDFSSERKDSSCELVINKIKASHEATYYCACYVSHSEKCWLVAVQKLCSVNQEMNRWQTLFTTGRELDLSPASHISAPISAVIWFFQDTAEATQTASSCIFIFCCLSGRLSVVFVTALFTVWGSYRYKIFGSGTRLYVADRPVVPPKVSIYPATRVDLKGKSSLLCLATSMFPPEVQFSWRTKDNKRIPEGERVELREEEHATAIVLINQPELMYQYICSVKHQGGTVEAKIQPELPAPTTSLPPVRDTTKPPARDQTDTSAASIPPVTDTAEPPAGEQSDVSFQFQCRVKLLSLVSTVMIVKSMVYCCGLSLLIIHRNKGPAD